MTYSAFCNHKKSGITAAILAGGQSQRMGYPKASVLLWDERSMIEHVIHSLETVCTQLVILGECQGYDLSRYPDIIQLTDLHPGHGPISGIETLLASGLDDQYLVVSCDQPLLRASVLQKMIDVMIPERLHFFCTLKQQHLDPLPGIYPASWLPVLQQHMREGQYSLRRAIEGESPKWVPISGSLAETLESINTPEQLLQMNSRHQQMALKGVH